MLAAEITAEIAVLLHTDAGTPPKNVTRVPARLKTGGMEVRRCVVRNLGPESDPVKITAFLQIQLDGQSGVPVPCTVIWPREAAPNSLQKEWPKDDKKDATETAWARQFIAEARATLQLQSQEFTYIAVPGEQLHSTVVVEASNLETLLQASGAKRFLVNVPDAALMPPFKMLTPSEDLFAGVSTLCGKLQIYLPGVGKSSILEYTDQVRRSHSVFPRMHSTKFGSC